MGTVVVMKRFLIVALTAVLLFAFAPPGAWAIPARQEVSAHAEYSAGGDDDAPSKSLSESPRAAENRSQEGDQQALHGPRERQRFSPEGVTRSVLGSMRELIVRLFQLSKQPQM